MFNIKCLPTGELSNSRPPPQRVFISTTRDGNISAKDRSRDVDLDHEHRSLRRRPEVRDPKHGSMSARCSTNNPIAQFLPLPDTTMYSTTPNHATPPSEIPVFVHPLGLRAPTASAVMTVSLCTPLSPIPSKALFRPLYMPVSTVFCNVAIDHGPSCVPGKIFSPMRQSSANSR